MNWKVITVQYLFDGKFYTKKTYDKIRREYLTKLEAKRDKKRKIVKILDSIFYK